MRGRACVNRRRHSSAFCGVRQLESFKDETDCFLEFRDRLARNYNGVAIGTNRLNNNSHTIHPQPTHLRNADKLAPVVVARVEEEALLADAKDLRSILSGDESWRCRTRSHYSLTTANRQLQQIHLSQPAPSAHFSHPPRCWARPARRVRLKVAPQLRRYAKACHGSWPSQSNQLHPKG